MENPLTPMKKFGWKTNGHLFGFGTSAEADWKIIFVSTVVLAILAMVLSLYIYIKIDKGEIFVIEKTAGQGETTLGASLLKETVSYYKNKAIEFKRIKNVVKPAADPSL